MAGSRPEQSQLLGMDMQNVRTSLIYPITPMDALGLFARTCKKAEAETALLRILHCAAFALPESGQQKDKTNTLAAIAMLKTHPRLLFQKGYTRLPSGQLVYGSPYQIFLGSGDIWARNSIHEEIIPLIEGGEATALKQYMQQFPNPSCALARFTKEDLIALKGLMESLSQDGTVQVSDDLQAKIMSMNDDEDAYTKVFFEKQELVVIHQLLSEYKREDLCTKLYEVEMLYDDRNKAQIAHVKELLKEIVEAFSVGPLVNEERTVNAIRALREYLAPKKEAIRTGLYFPPEIMKIIYDVYHENIFTWNGNQLYLYAFEVIGGAERFVSAVDAQCYKKGLSSFDIKADPDRTVSYFIRSGIPADLGSSCFVDVYDGSLCVAGVEGVALANLDDTGVWKTYVEEKFRACKSYAAARIEMRSEDISGCNMLK